MRDKRRHARYDVRRFSTFSAQVKPNFLKECELGQFSLGGCGFFASPRISTLMIGHEVECKFRWPDAMDGEILVMGTILYGNNVKTEDGIRLLVGVKFKEGQENILLPILKHLEFLDRQGKIKLSP